MSANALRSCALAVAVLVAGASPLHAADRNMGSLPRVDFTLASSVPVASSIVRIAPPALLTDTTVEPAPAPAPDLLAETAQRRVDVGMPIDDGDATASLRRSMYVSFAALQIMDAVSTRKALNSGAREANPLLGGIARNNAALFAVKAGTAAATTFFAEKLAKKHPRRATIMMAVLNTAYAAIAAHNYRVAKR